MNGLRLVAARFLYPYLLCLIVVGISINANKKHGALEEKESFIPLGWTPITASSTVASLAHGNCIYKLQNST